MLLGTLICLALAATCNGATSWSYNNTSAWGNDFPICNGQRQSPIDIVTNSAVFDDNLPVVDRNIFYQPPTTMSVSNNGHSITVGFDAGAYTINDLKLLPFPAKAAQYHMHWGTANSTSFTPGSEHTVDGKQYFGELHVVHYNTKYPNIGAAINQSDGLAVFGWFIDVTYPQINLDIQNLLDLANASASVEGSDGNIAKRFSVETLIPANLNEYYRYDGSLTTPGCFESVVWTVFKQPIEITQAQAHQLASSFYETNTTAGPLIVNNFRPTLPLNGRRITKPRPLVQQSSTATTPAPVTTTSGAPASKPLISVGFLALIFILLLIKQ